MKLFPGLCAAIVAVAMPAVATSKGVKLTDLPAPEGPAVVAPSPEDWPATQKARQEAKAAYLRDNKVALDWFTDFPFSQVDGIPMVLLRLLPTVAPEIWGPTDQFGASFGLFARPQEDTLPLPVGIGLAGLERPGAGQIDYTSFTCAACHIGRVETAPGQTAHIVGGVNSEFNIVKFFVDVERTLNQLGGDAKGEDRKSRISAAFTQAANTVSAQDPHYVYGNAWWGDKAYDAVYEARQIQAFVDQSDALTGDFVDYIDDFVAAYGTYLDKTYDGFQAQMLAGLPGMADATGVSSSHGYEIMLKSFVGKFFAKDVLPDHPGLSDFMLVWEQDARTARWNADGTELIDGGGQLNGNIPIPIYRNLAASMTMGLAETDVRIAAFAAELLGGLPADPYPFAVDEALAKQGEQLFAENCATCHQPNNGALYRNIGTDPSRSMVINKLLEKGARSVSLETCGPDTVVVLENGPVKPCASFDGRPITPEVVMRSRGAQYGGYNATALRGIWAGAPYLHNGSVPTLYHLLMPNERPQTFVKSALSYDQRLVGFSWAPGTEGGYRLDTTAFEALSNRGHDRDITDGDTTYRLDWTDDPDAAMAIVEYLKTL